MSKEVNVKLRIDTELHEQLKAIAVENEGTVAAEMRKALRHHVRVQHDLTKEIARLRQLEN